MEKNQCTRNNGYEKIFSLLEQNPVCRKIVTCLLKHRERMDAVEGVAEWWIQEDLWVTQEAIDDLVACGVVIVRTYAGINLYSFTHDLELQAKLEEYFHNRNGV